MKYLIKKELFSFFHSFSHKLTTQLVCYVDNKVGYKELEINGIKFIEMMWAKSWNQKTHRLLCIERMFPYFRASRRRPIFHSIVR